VLSSSLFYGVGDTGQVDRADEKQGRKKRGTAQEEGERYLGKGFCQHQGFISPFPIRLHFPSLSQNVCWCLVQGLDVEPWRRRVTLRSGGQPQTCRFLRDTIRVALVRIFDVVIAFHNYGSLGCWICECQMGKEGWLADSSAPVPVWHERTGKSMRQRLRIHGFKPKGSCA
jgi:hypothetical protein